MYNEIKSIIVELEEDLEKLMSVDISLKKGEDRLKQANEIGREEYVNSVNKLIDYLEDSDKDVIEVSARFDKFYKDSAKSYERTTLLIGKEMESIVNNIRKLSKIVEMFKKDNLDLINKDKDVRELLSKYFSEMVRLR